MYERQKDGSLPGETRYCPAASNGCNLKLEAGVVTWQGNKDFQEDRYILGAPVEVDGFEGGTLFAVLDGHNGGRCADYVEQKLPENY